MLAIREEISAIERGDVAHDDSALAHAPHTAADLLVYDWPRAYTREQAAYPVSSLRQDKYWPPVSRIDGGYGDRNLMCACPPPSAFETEAELPPRARSVRPAQPLTVSAFCSR